MTFQSLAFDGIIPALQAGTVDTAVGAITITQARSQVVSFSRPYFKGGLAIATRADRQSINAFDDLKGKSIAVQIGTTGALAAKRFLMLRFRHFDAAVLALQELKNGMSMQSFTMLQFCNMRSKLETCKTCESAISCLARSIRNSDSKEFANLERINQGLATVFSNGTYAQPLSKMV